MHKSKDRQWGRDGGTFRAVLGLKLGTNYLAWRDHWLGKRRAGGSGRRGWNDTAGLSAALKDPSDKFLKIVELAVIISTIKFALF